MVTLQASSGQPAFAWPTISLPRDRREPAMPATIDDTYAEAFRSIYAAVLITARDRYWLDRAVAGRDRQREFHHPVRLRGRARPVR